VITGRGPGAPGITPGLEFTRRRGGPGGTGHGAVDLGEIRRSEELIGWLAARGGGGVERRAEGAGGPPPPAGTGAWWRDDPAAALLAALVADVDLPGAADELASRRVLSRGRGAARETVAGVPSRGLATWLRAGVAGAVVASLAGTTSLITASMLARLYRGTGSRGRVPSRGWPPGGRPRRYR
jgi:hypothetical protein